MCRVHVALSLTAASLLASAIAACAPAVTAPPSGASMAPSTAPASVGPSVTASTTPAPSVAPSTAPTSAPVGPTANLQGRVFDDAENLIADGTSITVHSLSPTQPFDFNATTSAGGYLIANIPVNVLFTVTATRPGYTRRTQVYSLRRNDNNNQNYNVLNFGGSAAASVTNNGYFLSNYPEIESVQPTDNTASQPANQMTFQLVMSEPLDATNQRRLGSAFRIIPNNAQAIGDTDVLPTLTASSGDLNGLYAGTSGQPVSPYQFTQNAGYMAGAITANFSWAADNKTATFTLPAPIKTGNLNQAQYAFLLVQQDPNPIKDSEGLILGQDANGKHANPGAGNIVRSAIKPAELGFQPNTTLDDQDLRWNKTHQSFTTFQVAPDTTAPQVVSVLARRNYSDVNGQADRIELAFSKPMLAYPAIAGSQLLSLNNYVIATSATAGTLDALTFTDAGKATAINANASAQQVSSALTAAANGIVLGANAAIMPGAPSGNFSIGLSPVDAKVVIIRLLPGSLPLDANFIKVFAANDGNAPQGVGKAVTDPAGNAVDSANNQKSGPIQ